MIGACGCHHFSSVPALMPLHAVAAGPFKQARSITIAPQLRFFFFRTTFGLPQSPRQVLQFLLDPTLQLVCAAPLRLFVAPVLTAAC